MTFIVNHFLGGILLAVASDACTHGKIQITNKTYLINGVLRECHYEDVQLINKSYIIAGGLQICVNDTWATVCHSNWDMNDATVACKELEYSYVGICLGLINTNLMFTDITCSGNEDKLIDCNYTLPRSNCNSAAGIYCEISTVSLPNEYKNTTGVNCTADNDVMNTSMINMPYICPMSSSCFECEAMKDKNGLVIAENQDCNNNSVTTIMVALATMTALLGVTLIGVILCWILTCLKFHKVSVPSKYSMENVLYKTIDSPKGKQTFSFRSSSQDIFPSKLETSPQHLEQPSKIKSGFSDTAMEDKLLAKDDQLHSKTHDENTTKKVDQVEEDQFNFVLHNENVPDKDIKPKNVEDDQMYSVLHDKKLDEKIQADRVYSTLFSENIAQKESKHDNYKDVQMYSTLHNDNSENAEPKKKVRPDERDDNLEDSQNYSVLNSEDFNKIKIKPNKMEDSQLYSELHSEDHSTKRYDTNELEDSHVYELPDEVVKSKMSEIPQPSARAESGPVRVQYELVYSFLEES